MRLKKVGLSLALLGIGFGANTAFPDKPSSCPSPQPPQNMTGQVFYWLNTNPPARLGKSIQDVRAARVALPADPMRPGSYGA